MSALHPPRYPARLSCILAPLVISLALGGCGTDTEAAAAPAASTIPSPADLPDCGTIAAATDGFLAGWMLDGESGPWGSMAERHHGLSCNWTSPRMQSDSAFEVVQGAGFGISITVDPDMKSEADVRSIGWVVDDPAVQAMGGYLVHPSGRLEFQNQLVGPIRLIKGAVSVEIGQMGVALINEVEEGRPMTNRRAVDTAIAVRNLVNH